MKRRFLIGLFLALSAEAFAGDKVLVVRNLSDKDDLHVAIFQRSERRREVIVWKLIRELGLNAEHYMLLNPDLQVRASWNEGREGTVPMASPGCSGGWRLTEQGGSFVLVPDAKPPVGMRLTNDTAKGNVLFHLMKNGSDVVAPLPAQTRYSEMEQLNDNRYFVLAVSGKMEEGQVIEDWELPTAVMLDPTLLDQPVVSYLGSERIGYAFRVEERDAGRRL